VPYKTGGISVLYSQLQLPVVPVALNTGLFWGRNALLKKPGVAVIQLLPPIAAGMEAAEMLKMLRERIESSLS
jgi:1-acyl-sn-glycerol-3-phosphate acyltransferase